MALPQLLEATAIPADALDDFEIVRCQVEILEERGKLILVPGIVALVFRHDEGAAVRVNNDQSFGLEGV